MNTNYIIIGDSITYGIGDFESCGWAAMFKKYIVNKDNSKVCNNYVHIAGFPGAKSSDILVKLDSILQAFENEEFSNTVILSIGINDTQVFNEEPRTDINKYKSNMKKIIKKILDRKYTLVILGLTRVDSDKILPWKPNKYYDNDIILDYTKELEKLCTDNKIKYISMQDVLEEGDFSDGLHPNHNGHKKIAEHVIKFIK